MRIAITVAEPPPEPLPSYPLATLDMVAARAVLADHIGEFMAEVASYWTIDPLDAACAPQPGPPSWAAMIGGEAAHEAAWS